ncbi:MAG: signal recognition particle-docking protein FtsY, partial [Cytophagales bacterium]|nr:signal recognition particle-docking protein FtsY [Cytophagales bacterium]
MSLLSFFTKEHKESLNKGLEKTKEGFFTKLSKAVVGKAKVDTEVLDELEEILISSDVGVDTTLKIIDRVEKRVARDKYLGTEELGRILKEEIASLLAENKSSGQRGFGLPEGAKPFVMMVVGVNGVGKTTTIGKLAAQFHRQGLRVVLGAGRYFR